RRHVRSKRLEVRLAVVAVAERVLRRVSCGVTLLVDHAPDEPRFEIHHALRIREIARQLRVRALHDTGAEAEITCGERDLLRAARLLPQLLATRFPQLGGIAVLQRFAVFRDLVDGPRLLERTAD